MLVLILTLVSSTPRAQAAALGLPQRHGGPVTLSGFNGELASADLATLVDGCLYNEVQVYAGGFTDKNSPGAPTSTQGVSVILSSYNICTGEWPIYASGYIPLTAATSPIDPQLKSAHTQTTVVVMDYDFGISYTMSVDLTWAGVGDLLHAQLQSHGHIPGCITNFQYLTHYRSSALSGTVSGAGINFTANDLIFAQLSRFKNGSILVGCG